MNKIKSDSDEYISQHYQSLVNLKSDFRNYNLTNLIISKIKGNSVLDIGSGRGTLLLELKKSGKKTFGIEPNEDLIKISKNLNLNIIKGSAENLTILFKEKVDTITMIDILEHIKDDSSLIKNLSSKLNNKGKIIIVVPANSFLYGKRDKNAGHYRRYSKNQLKNLIKINNFKILKIRHWNMLGFLPYFFYEKILKKEINDNIRKTSKKGFFKRLINNFLNLWFRYIENNIDFGFGLSLICIAEKID